MLKKALAFIRAEVNHKYFICREEHRPYWKLIFPCVHCSMFGTALLLGDGVAYAFPIQG